MLCEHPILKHSDLDTVILLPHQHLPVHRLAARQKLRLSHNVTAASHRPGLAAAGTFSFKAG